MPIQVTGSVTNAAGGSVATPPARRIFFIDGALDAGSLPAVKALVSAVRLASDKKATLRLIVRADPALAPDAAWLQLRERINALSSALVAAGLGRSRFVFELPSDQGQP